MSDSYTQLLFQIVISTKDRVKVMLKENRYRLLLYIRRTLINKKCHPYIINGVEDHLHIITHLHQAIALAELVQSIKVSSSLFIKGENLFPKFKGWQVGYGGFTYAISAKENLIRYVQEQESHHHKTGIASRVIKSWTPPALKHNQCLRLSPLTSRLRTGSI